MAKKDKTLNEMNIFELHQMKCIVSDLSNDIAVILDKYRGCDYNTYLSNMDANDKILMDKRILYRKLQERSLELEKAP